MQELAGAAIPVKPAPAAVLSKTAIAAFHSKPPVRVPDTAPVEEVAGPVAVASTNNVVAPPVVSDAPVTVDHAPKASAKPAVPVPDQPAAPVMVMPLKVPDANSAPASSGLGSGRVARKPEAAKTVPPATPFAAVVIPEIVPPVKPPKAQAQDSQDRSSSVAALAPRDEAPAPVGIPAAAAVKIHQPDTETAPAVQPLATNVPKVAPPVPAQVMPPQPVATTQATNLPIPHASPAMAVPVAAPPAVQQHSQPAKPAPLPSTTAQIDEPLAAEPKTQPVKALSIEFAPDGAQDVRVRLSEHAGDVHISLHTADPSLSGRLNDGVKDLVDSLTTAGYDAQAWTPDEGRQNQRQAEEPRRMRNQGSSDPDAENFSSLMHPLEEIS